MINYDLLWIIYGSASIDLKLKLRRYCPDLKSKFDKKLVLFDQQSSIHCNDSVTISNNIRQETAPIFKFTTKELYCTVKTFKSVRIERFVNRKSGRSTEYFFSYR